MKKTYRPKTIKIKLMFENHCKTGVTRHLGTGRADISLYQAEEYEVLGKSEIIESP